MSSDDKNRGDDANFSFAVRELRQARAAMQPLALDQGPKSAPCKATKARIHTTHPADSIAPRTGRA